MGKKILKGTTHVFENGRKLTRKGLPPRKGSRIDAYVVLGSNTIGQPYDVKSGYGWLCYKYNWVCHLERWNAPLKWRALILQHIWENEPENRKWLKPEEYKEELDALHPTNGQIHESRQKILEEINSGILPF